MKQNTEEQRRDSVNKGKNAYKVLVNIFIIVLLIQLYRSLYVTGDGYHWMYGVGVAWFILKLAIIHVREKRAYEMGLTYYDYLEHRKKELKDKFKNEE